MDKQSVLGNNDIDDVRWLCSLTESELDLLMGLKNLVHLRAKKIGHEDLAEKFDLSMLRTVSFYFMENLEGRLKDLLGPTSFGSNILNHNLSDDFGSMTIEDLYPFICYDKKKRNADINSLSDLSSNEDWGTLIHVKALSGFLDFVGQDSSNMFKHLNLSTSLSFGFYELELSPVFSDYLKLTSEISQAQLELLSSWCHSHLLCRENLVIDRLSLEMFSKVSTGHVCKSKAEDRQLKVHLDFVELSYLTRQ